MRDDGKSVRLFLVDGGMSGIVTAEVVNWTGHLVLSPISRIAEFVRRPEASKTGVYMLFSELVSLGGKRSVYIGESDEVGRRILQHSKNDAREFSSFVLITSKDLNLTKAHARYIENRLTELAHSSGRAMVENRKEPTQGALPESDIADMAYFVEQVRLALPVLGFEVLKEPFVSSPNKNDTVSGHIRSDSDVILLSLAPNRKGLQAKAKMKDDEVLVLAGSWAVKNPEYASNQFDELRNELIAGGALVESADTKYLCFAYDVEFSSPSAAAAFIRGRSANGRTDWLTADTSQTLRDYQNAQAEAAL